MKEEEKEEEEKEEEEEKDKRISNRLFVGFFLSFPEQLI